MDNKPRLTKKEIYEMCKNGTLFGRCSICGFSHTTDQHICSLCYIQSPHSIDNCPRKCKIKNCTHSDNIHSSWEHGHM